MHGTPHTFSTPPSRRAVNVLQRGLALLAFWATSTNGAALGSPNVLLIVADDYGIDESRLYGVPAVDDAFDRTPNHGAPATPNLVALARNGIVFENVWSTPGCSPTRATIMTGRYGFRTGVGFPIGPPPFPSAELSESEFTLPEALDANPQRGYGQGLVGKWHLTDDTDPLAPNRAGWTRFAGTLIGFAVLPPDILPPGTSMDTYFQWMKTTDGVTETSRRYATTDQADEALAFIRRQQASNTPWVLQLAFTAPHDPYHLPPKDLHDFDDLSGAPEDIADNPRPYFEAMVQAMDSEIGRVLGAVNLRNTTVIFVGDNGTDGQVVRPPFDPTKAKGSLFEGGIRVPLVVAGSGVSRPGRRVAGLVNTTDLFATVLELAGVDVNRTVPGHIELDSISMVPYLDGTSASERRWIYTEQFLPPDGSPPLGLPVSVGQTIRDTRYKLDILADGDERFFDLWKDPFERRNLIGTELSAPASRAQRNLRTTLSNLGVP